MKLTLLLALFSIAFLIVIPLARAQTQVTAPDAASRVHKGEAVLIDVREPSEWAEGVVEGAQLLSLTDLQGDRQKWKPFLAAQGGKELIVYCRSGRRSGVAAKILAAEGYKVSNAGGYSDWVKAGQPTRKP